MRTRIFIALALSAFVAISAMADTSMYGSMWKQKDVTVYPADDIRYINISGATIFGNFSGSFGVTDHGALTGLADDDHTQYLLQNGSRRAKFLNISTTLKLQGIDILRTYPANAKGSLFIGYSSGASGVTTSGNTAVGYGTMSGSNANADSNTVVGYQAGRLLTGDASVAVGYQALFNSVNATSASNTGIGYQALYTLSSTGSNNTGIGREALRAYNAGDATAVGYYAFRNGVSHASSVALGFHTGENAAGQYNTMVGAYAGQSTNSAGSNTFVGYAAGRDKTSGTNNTQVGYAAGLGGTGSGNVMLGYSAGFNETGSNKLYIDNSNTATPLIYGDFSTDVLTINGDLYATRGYTPAFDKYSSLSVTMPITAEFVECWANNNAVTLNLPAVATTKTGKVYHIKKTDATANACTLDGNASENIDGVTTKAISAQYNSISILNNGTQWLIY